MKFSHCLIVLSVILQSYLTTQSVAHHGKDYFISKSYHTPLGGTWVALFSADYLRMSSEHERELRGFGFEPGILYGISDSWSLEVHSHIEKIASEGWHYESTGFEQRFQITRWHGSEERRFPIDVAAALEFEKSFSDEVPDVLQAGLIFSHDGLAHNITGNLLLRKEFRPSATTEVHYALGAKTELLEYLGIGIELNGRLARMTFQQITPGIYLQTESGLRLKLGMSLGLNGSQKDYAVRTSIVLDL